MAPPERDAPAAAYYPKHRERSAPPFSPDSITPLPFITGDSAISPLPHGTPGRPGEDPGERLPRWKGGRAHCEARYHDADFMLAAVAESGKTIREVTEEELKSGEDIRGPRHHGNRSIVVTDEDILAIDPTAGTVPHTIEL